MICASSTMAPTRTADSARGHALLSQLDRLRSGEPFACEAFVREHTPKMLSLARRYLRCEHEAADAVQDSFLSAFRSLHEFQGNSHPGTWLYRIVVNTCLMRLRSQSRRRMTSIENLLPTFDDDGGHDTPMNRWSEEPLFDPSTNDLRQAVRSCIEQLPEQYQSVLVLRDIEGFDTEQTAQILGTTPANTKVRLHRARHALRSLIRPACERASAARSGAVLP